MSNYSKFVTISTRYFSVGQILTASRKKLVVITGCDSGLGYSLSKHCHKMGMSVVSGCLNLDSDGSKALSGITHVVQLDVTKPQTVHLFHQKVNDIVTSDSYDLHAVVNNAGVMIFGEFEWLTEEQMLLQVQVNQIGTLRVAKAFLPLLRKYKGRLINVTSHCGLSCLPGISVYGATKAAIQNWSEGLRVEQRKYGVKVVTFIPGSLPMQTNIMLKQGIYAREMEKSLSEENRKFYLKYFKEFQSYLISLSDKRELVEIDDKSLYKKFEKALLDCRPKAVYIYEPWRYYFYYNSFKIAPTWLRDILVQKFMKFPKYKSDPTC